MVKTGRQRGTHAYYGKSTSKGKRSLSKIHKGLNSGNVEKAFYDMESIKRKETQNEK